MTKPLAFGEFNVEQHVPQLLKFGIAWEPQWKPKLVDKTEDKSLGNVWRAYLCRSLGRLEKRGLIIRIKGHKQARTVRVMLTTEGRKMA